MVTISYETKQLASKVWTMAQQFITLHQGNGVGFKTPDGTQYISKDFSGVLTSMKTVSKGSKGRTMVITMIVGHGYHYTYTYEWRE